MLEKKNNKPTTYGSETTSFNMDLFYIYQVYNYMLVLGQW